MYIVTLKKGKERRALEHPWVFANEVDSVKDKDKQGSVARVQSFDGKLVGYGFINHLSKIFIRFLSRKEEIFDKNFYANRIKEACEKRTLLGFNNACRLIFAESDGLPGLIVDRYGDYLCVQFLCLGMDLIKNDIINTLVELLQPIGIYERSDVSVREKEGLPLTKGILYGEVPQTVIFEENDILMGVNLEDGQKTGYFLDQKNNRKRFGEYARNKQVLDCFCNVGGFALNAAKGGAAQVLALDISSSACEAVTQNAVRNNLKIDVEQADVFERLRSLRSQGKQFDLIALDPPAFIKSVDSVVSGYKGYKDINICALKLLRKNGILFTCSCSQHLTMELFFNMLKESANQCGADVSLLEISIQGTDHACKLNEDEALYLKVAVLRKNN